MSLHNIFAKQAPRQPFMSHSLCNVLVIRACSTILYIKMGVGAEGQAAVFWVAQEFPLTLRLNYVERNEVIHFIFADMHLRNLYAAACVQAFVIRQRFILLLTKWVLHKLPPTSGFNAMLW